MMLTPVPLLTILLLGFRFTALRRHLLPSLVLFLLFLVGRIFLILFRLPILLISLLVILQFSLEFLRDLKVL